MTTHHGVADLQQKTLRMIGDLRTCYREDPVRMLQTRSLWRKGVSTSVPTPPAIREMATLIENVRRRGSSTGCSG